MAGTSGSTARSVVRSRWSPSPNQPISCAAGTVRKISVLLGGGVESRRRLAAAHLCTMPWCASDRRPTTPDT